MNFQLKPDPATGWRMRLVSQNEVVHLGISPVLYGWRVQAGFCADKVGVEITWCAGSEYIKAMELLGALLVLLQQRTEDEDCFDGLPSMSQVKPVWDDPQFMSWFNNRG